MSNFTHIKWVVSEETGFITDSDIWCQVFVKKPFLTKRPQMPIFFCVFLQKKGIVFNMSHMLYEFRLSVIKCTIYVI